MRIIEDTFDKVVPSGEATLTQALSLPLSHARS
jgi:hypothetical protein